MGGRRSQARCPDGGTGMADGGASADGPASRRASPHSRLGLLLVLLLVVSGVAGCGAFSAPEREEARAVVTTEEEAEVRIITSTRFTLDGGGQNDPGTGQQTPGVSLEEADTALVVPRFDRSFDISETRRFFIQVEPTDTVSVQATLEVFIDGESLGQLVGDLQDEPLRDVFASVEF